MARPVTDDALVGRDLGPYRIESVIGRGGMGVVYLALHVHLQHKRAVKVLSSELASDHAFRQRFLREARLPADLRHPNVMPVHDAGEVDGLLYLVMPHIRGRDLGDLLAERPMQALEVFDVLGGVADALDEAHARGLLHRDVKPSNVLIGEERDRHGSHHVYLSDFGLVKRLSGDTHLTDTGTVMGSLPYIAPEILRGESPVPASDQYSLACMLFQCLTGEVPFRAEIPGAVMSAHLFAEVPSASERAPSLPGDLDLVIARAMAKHPAERFSSCREFLDVARSVVVKETRSPTVAHPSTRVMTADMPSHPPTRVMTADTPPRSKPSRARMVGVAVVVLAAAGVVFAVSRRGDGAPSSPQTPSTAPAPVRVVATIGTSTPVVALALDDSGTLWAAQRRTHRLARVSAETNELTEAAGFLSGFADVSVGEGAVWVGLRTGIVGRVDLATGSLDQTLIACDRLVSIASGGGSVWAGCNEPFGAIVKIDPSTLEIQDTIDVGGLPVAIAVDGSAVWVATEGDLLEPQLVRLSPDAGSIVTEIDIARPSDLALGAGAVWVTNDLNNTVSRVDPASNEIERIIPVGSGPSRVAFSEDGVWVSNRFEDTISRIDPATNQVVETVRIDGSPGALAASDGVVWIADSFGSVIFRLAV